MRVLVCGSRDFDNQALLFAKLDELDSTHHFDTLIEGGASGADKLAMEWAQMRHIPVEEFPANWKEFGRSAGPIRNRQMLKEGYPELVVAFPKTILNATRGTHNMVEQAKKARIAVVVVEQLRDRVNTYIL